MDDNFVAAEMNERHVVVDMSDEDNLFHGKFDDFCTLRVEMLIDDTVDLDLIRVFYYLNEWIVKELVLFEDD